MIHLCFLAALLLHKLHCCYALQVVQKELGKYQKEVDMANASGEHLISDVLDDPAVTKQDLQDLNEAWENTCQLSVKKQERMAEALKDARKFEEGLNDLVAWIDVQSATLQSQLPPDEDASVLQQQIEVHKVRTYILVAFCSLQVDGLMINFNVRPQSPS